EELLAHRLVLRCCRLLRESLDGRAFEASDESRDVHPKFDSCGCNGTEKCSPSIPMSRQSCSNSTVCFAFRDSEVQRSATARTRPSRESDASVTIVSTPPGMFSATCRSGKRNGNVPIQLLLLSSCITSVSALWFLPQFGQSAISPFSAKMLI